MGLWSCSLPTSIPILQYLRDTKTVSIGMPNPRISGRVMIAKLIAAEGLESKKEAAKAAAEVLQLSAETSAEV